MIRVLHLRSGSGLYGADRALLALAQATQAPFEPIVGALTRDAHQDALSPAARALGLEAVHFASDRPFDLACARRIADELRTRGVRLLHAHDFKSLAMAALASSLTRTPVVATFHGDTDASLKLRAYEAIGRLLGNSTRGVAAVSRPLEARLRSWVKTAQVTFIANGLAPVAPVTASERARAREELGLGADEVVLAAIGRLSPEKGQAVLLEALRKLEKPPVTLLAGDGPDRPELERAARGLPVKFLGYRSEMRPIYAAADVIVLPSLTEGLPMTALEAGLYGKPLVATRVGELPQVLGPDADTLALPGDAASLRDALEPLCLDGELRRSRGARLQARVTERYGADVMAQAYATRLYEPALRGTEAAEELGSPAVGGARSAVGARIF